MLANLPKPSTRAEITERRTYLRPLNDEGTLFETFEQSIDRQIEHQRWLWERAKGGLHKDENDQFILVPLTGEEEQELEELRTLLLSRKATLSGRTSWLGGTEVAKRRESSMFNCSFLEVRTVYDVVDVLWLLLQGCGVGFRPIVGVLNGFQQVIPEIEVIRSKRKGKGGNANNKEKFNRDTGEWRITVGDSAEAWAKSIGKLVAGKYPAKKLVLDLSEIRPAGERLKGYGWISSGDHQIAIAYKAIADIFNKAAGRLLTRIEILDLINWLGTVLSSRRSAEICLMAYGEPEWQEFSTAKLNCWETGNSQRNQSNNTLLFYEKPSRDDLRHVFALMEQAGGSEPGFANAAEALRRAPWFRGFNPCAEILLGDKSFCNLVELVLYRFNGNFEALMRAAQIIARANYRQTCVWLDDGVLQRSWHELNQFLRLCGVGVTGVVSWDGADDAQAWAHLRANARVGAISMADDLGMPHPKAVTTIKPSGTKSKTLSLEGFECAEGVHKPLGRYIFNNIIFSRHDPMVKAMSDAGYTYIVHPNDAESVIVKIPVEYSNIQFDKVFMDVERNENRYLGHGDFETVTYTETVEVEVNLESAVSQLDRYKMTMENYVDHNTSITVSYDPTEVEDIVDWFMNNWDSFVGVSFLYRNDPTKTAKDLGYSYMPQEVVDKQTYHDYADSLKPINWEGSESELEVDSGADCATGACPVR